MKNRSTPLLDEHLESIKGMQVAEAGDLFYSKLRNRMLGEEKNDTLWKFPLRPVWVIGTLLLLLGLNAFMLTQEFRTKHISEGKGGSAIEKFAESYDQNIKTSY